MVFEENFIDIRVIEVETSGPLVVGRGDLTGGTPESSELTQGEMG